jgi:hypothetical protein
MSLNDRNQSMQDYGSCSGKNISKSNKHISHSTKSKHIIKYVIIPLITLSLIFLFISKFGNNEETILSTSHFDDSEQTSSTITTEQTTLQPNIIILMLDDLSWNSLYYNKSIISQYAPNILSLQSQGVTVTHYYSHAMCVPSRAAFVTGKYSINNGMQDVDLSPTAIYGLELQSTLFAQAFQASNYETHIIGKWHLGHYTPDYLPTARGYDTFLGYLSGEEYPFSKRLVNSDSIYDFSEMNTTCYHEYKGDNRQDYSTYIYRDRAIDIINNYSQSQKNPTASTANGLLLQVAFQAVHRYTSSM